MPSPADCAAQLLDVTPLVTRAIRSEMRRRTMPGLSIQQFRVLTHLHHRPGASLSEVAEFLGLTMPSTSKLIQRLVTQNVVERRVGGDRRRVSLSLTMQGTAALELARLETRGQLETRLRHLSKEELAAIAAALAVLARAFAEGGTDVNVP